MIKQSEILTMDDLRDSGLRFEWKCEIIKRYNAYPDQQTLIEELVKQFAYWRNGGYVTGGLSVLESAFAYLRWDEPHIDKSAQCRIGGCREQITCGINTKDGYKNVCGKHYHILNAALTAEKEKEKNDTG